MRQLSKNKSPEYSAENNERRKELSYRELLRLLSHDLSAPVRQIKMLHTIFIDELDAKLSASQMELHQHIEQAISVLEARMGTILSASGLLTRQPCPDAFNVAQPIDIILTNLEQQHPNIRQCIDIKIRGEDVCFDRGHFSFVLEELLTNSCKFYDSKRSLNISVEISVNNDKLTLIVKDNGIGFDSEQVHHVQLPFTRLEGGKYPGIGAGLYLISTLVGSYGGSLDINASRSSGCQITLMFPLDISLGLINQQL